MLQVSSIFNTTAGTYKRLQYISTVLEETADGVSINAVVTYYALNWMAERNAENVVVEQIHVEMERHMVVARVLPVKMKTPPPQLMTGPEVPAKYVNQTR